MYQGRPCFCRGGNPARRFHHPLLNDSRKLTEARRDLREVIKEAADWAVAEVSAAEIDQINILKASFWLCTGPSMD
jgi:ribonuclease HII